MLFLATTHFAEILFNLMVPHLTSQLLSHLSFYLPLCIPSPPSQAHTNPCTYRNDCLESKHLPWSDPELCTVPWIIVGNQQIVFMLKTYVSNWSKLSGIHPTLHSWTVHATLNPCIPLQCSVYTGKILSTWLYLRLSSWSDFKWSKDKEQDRVHTKHVIAG